MSLRALRVLGRTELRGRRRLPSILLLAVMTVAAAGIVAGAQSQARAEDQWNAAFDRARGPHVLLYSRDAAAIRAISADRRVATAGAPITMTADVHVAGEPPNAMVTVRDAGAVGWREPDGTGRGGIGGPLLKDGRWVRAGSSDEIVVDRAFALDRGIAVGDRITLDRQGVDTTLRVVGRAVDFADCFFPGCDPAPAWADAAALDRIDPAARASGERIVPLRLRDPLDVDGFVTWVLDRYPAVATNDWLDTRDDSLGTSRFFGSFLSGFGVFVMIAAALVIAGSMSGRVLARRREIGLLKAAGFTPRQVATSLLLPSLAIGAVAAALGWVVGGFLAGPMQLTVSKVLGNGRASFALRDLVTAFLAIEIIVVVATVLPAWRTARVATTEALAPVPPRNRRAARAGRLSRRLRLGPVADAGVREAGSRPGRSVFAVLALALAVVSVMISAGFARTMNGTFDDPARVGAPYAVRIDLPAEDREAGARVAAVLDQAPGVRSWFAGSERRVVLDGSAFLGRLFDGDLAGAGFIVQQGRLPAAADEAMAGYGWLQRFGRRIGDRVTVEIGGQPLSLRVVGAYTEMEDSGEILRIPMAALQRVAPDATADQFYVTAKHGTGPKALAGTLQARLRGVALVTPNQISPDAEIDAFWLAFELVTGLVLLVALSNLGTTLLLAVRERVRDTGLLRSVGFTPRQALTVTAIAAGILGLVALLIGIPVGWAAYRALITSVGEGSGVGPTFGIDPSLLVVTAFVPVGIAVAVGLGVAVARRSARASVADLVRYE